MRKLWQTSIVKTWGISIDEFTYAKEYPKCAHVCTRRREVKKFVITCIPVLNE